MRPRTWIASIGIATLGIVALASASRFGHACPCDPIGHAVPEEAGAMRSVTLGVEGMSCGSCALTIRIALKKLEGVKDAKVSFDEKRAVIDYDPAKVTPEQMVAAIVKLGYEARVKG